MVHQKSLLLDEDRIMSINDCTAWYAPSIQPSILNPVFLGFIQIQDISGGLPVKNSPDRGLGHLLTLTLTSDDLESHIVVKNVSLTSNIIPSFIKIERRRFFGKV